MIIMFGWIGHLIAQREARKIIEEKFDVDLEGFELIDIDIIRINGENIGYSLWDNGVETKKFGLLFTE